VDARSLALIVVVSAAAASCGDDAASSATDASACFVAFASAFEGYRSWTSFHDEDTDALDGVHPAGGRTEYINHVPPHGSVGYPVGTIIVKEPTDDPSGTQIFAMVKRGCDYNATGADNWEWFEIAPQSDGSVSIVWRGAGPPNGTTYGGDPTGGCNTCHSTGRADDFVLSSAFSLSTF
jgi:hypothetical protein